MIGQRDGNLSFKNNINCNDNALSIVADTVRFSVTCVFMAYLSDKHLLKFLGIHLKAGGLTRTTTQSVFLSTCLKTS